MTLTEKYIDFRNVYGVAEGQIGFIREMLNVQFALQILIFISLYFGEFSGIALLLAPIGIISYVMFVFVFGRYLDRKLKIVDTDRKWQNKRNPEIREIYQLAKNTDVRLRRIEAKLR